MAKANQHMPVQNNKVGSLKIADDVVARIAGIAAMDVEGVHAMAGNVGREAIAKVSVGTLQKGVKVMMGENGTTVDLALLMNYGFNIPATCREVQEKVKHSVANMTGLKVTDVNVRVNEIVMT